MVSADDLPSLNAERWGFTVSIQTSIQANVESYPPSMKRVAGAILGRPQGVLEKTISELARSCATSETSIVRFCRTLGFTGFPALKLQMAAELATEAAQFGSETRHGTDIRPTDTLADTVSKITRSEILGIQETAANLDMVTLEQVISRLEHAGRIVLYGVGASNAGAQDLTQKLLRIGCAAFGFHDAHDALASAALLGPGDVAIAFSHSGRTREAVELLHAARRGGAFTVAITNVEKSPVTEHADKVLRTAVRETTFRSGAMASRIAQLTLVDYLFVGVARGNYKESVQALKSTYESVGALRDDR